VPFFYNNFQYIFLENEFIFYLGLIINIGSVSGGLVTPQLTVYAASKSFVNLFSRCLFYEYEPNGVLIQHISPAFVRTKMSRMRNWFMVPTAKTFVQSALCSATRLQVH